MKKHSAMFLSFTALFTFSALAPQFFWDYEKEKGRFPSSLEEDRLEELELKKQDSIQCTAEDNSKKLEEQMQKLLEDKESILKELEALKKEKNQPVAREVVKQDPQSQILDIMSHLTSLMISSQQQQQQMMQQMFSMMASPRHNSFQMPLEHISPYVLSYDQIARPYQTQPDLFHILEDRGMNIGLSHYQSVPYSGILGGEIKYDANTYAQTLGFGRAPSQDYRIQNNFSEQQFITPEMIRTQF